MQKRGEILEFSTVQLIESNSFLILHMSQLRSSDELIDDFVSKIYLNGFSMSEVPAKEYEPQKLSDEK